MENPEEALMMDQLMRRYRLSSHQLLSEPAELVNAFMEIAAEEAKQQDKDSKKDK